MMIITKGYIKCIGFCTEIFINYDRRTEDSERFKSCYSQQKTIFVNIIFYRKDQNMREYPREARSIRRGWACLVVAAP